MAWWGEGHTEPWCILTDLDPDGCDASWYGLRTWCEQGFKIYKRGGWQWQQTRMTDPDRAARLWLALAVATLWLVSLGSGLESDVLPADGALPDLQALVGIAATRLRPRHTRLFRLGWLWFLVQQITAQPLPLPQRLVPEPWPDVPQRLEVLVPQQPALSYAPA
ncbi:MAG: hypothetical protein M3325_17040 [Actinomycetota bacterium]|nr:hypothetical protein [Actinomycetota bacterium]